MLETLNIEKTSLTYTGVSRCPVRISGMLVDFIEVNWIGAQKEYKWNMLPDLSALLC